MRNQKIVYRDPVAQLTDFKIVVHFKSIKQGRHFNFFLRGLNFFHFQCHRTIKIGKNSTLLCRLVIDIIHSSLFSFFFSYSFFLPFLFSLGGRRHPSPSNDAPAIKHTAMFRITTVHAYPSIIFVVYFVR